ncbi:MAG: NAD(P)H-hydrate dehydratase [Bacteroidetes bacterium]|nr:NAD(P)H-hydrate dehydratase [Bacteroidota bacterium]
MRAVLTKAESKAYDEFLIKKIGMLPAVLMENAARGALDSINDWLVAAPAKSVLIFCGGGNNGGDGFALARLLTERGSDVDIVMLATPAQLSKDAAQQYGILRKILGPESFHKYPFSDSHFLSHLDLCVIVDAMLGTGASGKLRDKYADAVVTMNQLAQAIGANILAVDIPTGLDADTGDVPTVRGQKPIVVLADRTATMGAFKQGFFQGFAPDVTGDVSVIGLGVAIDSESAVNMLDISDIRPLAPSRFKTASKYDEGVVLSIAGSIGMTGAAIMSAEAALKSGCGLVTVATPESQRPIVAAAMPEIMTIALEDSDGEPIGKSLASLGRSLERADVILLGPGLRDSDSAKAYCKMVLGDAELPIIADAGALAAIADDVTILKKRKAPTVLTPHAGEMSRMLGIDRDELEAHRIEYAIAFAKAFKVVVVLKGAPTVIASPDSKAFISPTGNAGMATAGTGDVLAGMIAGFVAREPQSVLNPTIFAVYAHGLAGDVAAKEKTQNSLVATDLIAVFPETFKQLGLQ